MKAIPDANSANQWRLTMLCLIGAAASATFIKLVKSQCEPCAAAEYLAPMPHLELIGVAFYSLLALAIWRYKLNRYTIPVVYFAAGCHVALIYKLVKAHLFCIPCLICGLFVAAAAALLIRSFNRVAWIAAFCGCLTIYGANSINKTIALHKIEERTKIAIHFDKLDLKAKKGLPFYVFKHDTCGVCRQFLADDLPRLRTMYGNRLDIRLVEAPPGVGVPTVVVGGNNPVIHVGRTGWEDISKLIDGRLDDSGQDLASAYSL
jgi:hypothetical protein